MTPSKKNRAREKPVPCVYERSVKDEETRSDETLQLVAQACDRFLETDLPSDDLLNAIISELNEADRLDDLRRAQIE